MSEKTFTVDPESQRSPPPTHWRIVWDQALVTPEVLNHRYVGQGTEESPYIVEWLPEDPRNPMQFPAWKKWSLTLLVAFATLAVAFVSSAYTGGVRQILMQFNVSQEVVTLGVSLYVLGFAVGPLLWAPLSELFGRQVLFLITYGALTAFSAGAAGAQNIQTLLILRFFAGAFGSSPLTNAGGSIADMFSADQRGLAMSVFAAAPFMGPVLGPIAGGFLGQSAGWRWVEGLMAAYSGALWIICGFLVPETYAPVLLRKRAAKLSKMTGKVYKSKMEAKTGKIAIGELFKTALSRPWILLFKEPIVLVMSIYMAVIYGVLYMLFGAFPIVYQVNRGWSEGLSGLAFLGIAFGMLAGVAYTIPDNKRYMRAMRAGDGIAPPEARLPPGMVGAVALPIGLFWFAWTNSPSVHWIVSIAAGAPFGFGMVLVFLSIMNYLIDSMHTAALHFFSFFLGEYLLIKIFFRLHYFCSICVGCQRRSSESVWCSIPAIHYVCATVVVILFLRQIKLTCYFRYMYNRLGIHWASTIPAFLALACMPFPFLFYKYGPQIREHCAYAAEAAAFMRSLRNSAESGSAGSSDEAIEKRRQRDREAEAEEEAEGVGNPFDIDRVNSHEVFTRVQTNKSIKSGR